MRRPAWLLAATLAAGACSGSSAPAATPALINVFWVAGGQRSLVWTSTQPDAGLGTVAAPAVQQVDFVFDQRLDGTKIEDRGTPPITLSWPDAAGGTTELPAQVAYNSAPLYGGSSSFAFLRPAQTGVPSGQTVTFMLDHTRLTGGNNQPFVGPDQVSVTTGPLTALVRLPSGGDGGGTVPASFMVPVVFSNRVDADAVAPYLHASTPSIQVPVAVAADAANATTVYVTAACSGGWPTTQPVTVTVDSRAPDAFGGLLADPASGTFTAAGAGPSDGGCSM